MSIVFFLCVNHCLLPTSNIKYWLGLWLSYCKAGVANIFFAWVFHLYKPNLFVQWSLCLELMNMQYWAISGVQNRRLMLMCPILLHTDCILVQEQQGLAQPLDDRISFIGLLADHRFCGMAKKCWLESCFRFFETSHSSVMPMSPFCVNMICGEEYCFIN